MKKPLLLLFLVLGVFSRTYGQSPLFHGETIDIYMAPIKELFVSTGVGFGTHQNQRFSMLPSSGIGGGFQLGYSKQANNFWRIYLDGGVNFVGQKYDVGSTIIDASLNYAWMKGLAQTGRNKWYVGGDLETSVLFRKTAGLGNNASSVMYSSTLSAAVRGERVLGSSHWALGGELSLGLLSFVKMSDGYAYAAPQDFITGGNFNYEEGASLMPFSYGELLTVGKFHRIKSSISLIKNQHRIRWGAVYDWRLKAYDPYENGQLVQGTHLVKLYFAFKFGVRKNIVK